MSVDGSALRRGIIHPSVFWRKMSQVILLGAGASNEAGIPDDQSALPLLSKRLLGRQKYSSLADWLYVVYQSGRDNIGTEKFVKFVNETAFAPKNELSSEQVQIRTRFGSLLKEFALSVLDEIEDMLTVKFATSVEYLHPLVSFVSRHRDRCQLFTLNYDNAVEVAAASLGLEFASVPLDLEESWSLAAPFGTKPQFHFNRLFGSFDLTTPSHRRFTGESMLLHYERTRLASHWKEDMFEYRCIDLIDSKLTNKYTTTLLVRLLTAVASASNIVTIGFSFLETRAVKALIDGHTMSPEFARKTTVIDSKISPLQREYANFVSENFAGAEVELLQKTASSAITQLFGND